MGTWKKGAIFGFGKPSKDVSFCTDKRGVVHALARNGTELRHYMRGSKNPFPWEPEGRVIPGSFVGSGHISLFRDGNLQLIWPRSDGDNDHWWVNPNDFDDPSGDDDDNGDDDDEDDPDPIDKALSIKGNKFYYGDDEIRLAGCSRLEALWRALKIRGFDKGWGADYSQLEYEQDLIDSGMNFVRHLGVKDTQFLYDHCKRMKDAGIIVEIGVYRVDENEGILVNLEDMGDLAKLGNVFFDVCNEFIGSDESEIQTVVDIANNLRSQGCIVSAGAWSGDNGKRLSRLFHQRYSGNHITSTHREWDVETWNEALSYGKPVSFNEFFSQGNLSLNEVKLIMMKAFDMGIAVGYYGYRWPGIPHLSRFDPFDKDAIPKYAGELINRQ